MPSQSFKGYEVARRNIFGPVQEDERMIKFEEWNCIQNGEDIHHFQTNPKIIFLYA